MQFRHFLTCAKTASHTHSLPSIGNKVRLLVYDSCIHVDVSLCHSFYQRAHEFNALPTETIKTWILMAEMKGRERRWWRRKNNSACAWYYFNVDRDQDIMSPIVQSTHCSTSSKNSIQYFIWMSSNLFLKHLWPNIKHTSQNIWQ